MDDEQVLYLKAGDRIRLTPVDPWDLVTAIGSGPFSGTVAAADESNHEAIVLKLDQPLVYEGIVADCFRASTRHVGKKFGSSSREGSVFCNLSSLEEANAMVAEPASYDGRLVLLGDVSWESSSG